MNFAAGWRIVRADRQQRDIDPIMLADFPKPRKEGAVAAMENDPTICRNNESAEASVQIGEKSRAPMITRRKRYADRSEFYLLPTIEFVNDVKSEIMDEVADSEWDDDRLIGRDFAQGAAIEMVEMRVCNEHNIDRRQMMNLEAWLLQPLYDLQPFRPIWIDENVDLVCLNQKGCMTDPGKADLATLDFWKNRWHKLAGASNEERWNENFGQKIAPVPIRTRTQLHPGGAFGLRTISGRLTNDVPLAFFRKRNRHLPRTI